MKPPLVGTGRPDLVTARHARGTGRPDLVTARHARGIGPRAEVAMMVCVALATFCAGTLSAGLQPARSLSLGPVSANLTAPTSAATRLVAVAIPAVAVGRRARAPTPLNARGYPGWLPTAVIIPRDADAQAVRGKAASLRALRAGDLLFFATRGYVHHVSIYAGNGRMVQAPKTGSSVQTILVSTPSYARELARARRLIG